MHYCHSVSRFLFTPVSHVNKCIRFVSTVCTGRHRYMTLFKLTLILVVGNDIVVKLFVLNKSESDLVVN